MKGNKDSGSLGLSSLKDKSLSWKQRLSLAQDLWSSEKYVPRKEQVIVDWLTFTLHSSKSESLTAAEREHVWQVLAQVLSSEEVHKLSSAGDAINVSLWFYKDIQEALRDTDNTEHILACLLAITSVKCFKTFAYLSLEHLVELLSTCCLSFNKASANHRTATESAANGSWSAVLMNLVSRLQTATHRHSLPVTLIAAFANKLLVPVISAYACLYNDPVAELLMDTLICTLTHRDALKHYERYLKEHPTLNAAESKSTSAQKRENFVETVFKSIGEGLLSEEEVMRDTYIHVLSALYKSYLISCGESTFKLDRVGMLYALMQLPAGMKSQANKLKGWAGLLSLAAKYEIHSITSEVAPKEVAAFTKTISHLLTLSCTTTDWYHCITAILDINHKCVEKRLPQVLAVGWQQVDKIDEWEMEEAQAKLLKSLLSVYSQLRQLPKIVNALIDCVMSSESGRPLPALALLSLGELITATPPTVCYDLWLSLHTRVIEQTRSLSDKCGYRKCLACADVLHTIMYHMKVYDSNVPLSVRNKLGDSLSRVQTELSEGIQQCKQTASQRELKLPVLLLLLDACSAMMVLLYRYVNTSIDISPQLCIEPALHLVNSMLAGDVSKETESFLIFTSVKLCYHWLSFLELSPVSSTKSRQLDECIARVLDVWREGGVSEDSLQPWYSTVLDVKTSNFTTAIISFSSTSAMLAYISRSNSTNIDLFTSLLVRAGVYVYDHITDCSCCQEPEMLHISTTSTSHNSLRCINSCRCKEEICSYEKLQQLITACMSTGESLLYVSLVKEVILNVSSAFTDSPHNKQCEAPRSKRRKMSRGKEEGNKVGRTLALFFQSLQECGDVGSATESLPDLTNDVLTLPRVALNSRQLSRLLLATEVLHKVPLRCIDGATQKKMFYMSLVAIELLANTHHVQGDRCAVLRPHTLIFCQLVSSLTADCKLIEALDLQLVATLFGQLPTDMGPCKDAAIDMLVTLVCTHKSVFKKHKTYLDQLLNQLFSSAAVAHNQQVLLPLSVARAVLQSGPVKPVEPVVQWVMKRTNDLLDHISSDRMDGQVLSNDLLSWCCLAMSTDRKLSQVTQMEAITSLVVKELEVVVREESTGAMKRIELLLRYITYAASSTASSHLSGVDMTTLWGHVVCLVGTAGLSFAVTFGVISSLVTALDTPTLSVCLSRLRTSSLSDGHLLSLVHTWRSIVSMGENSVRDKQSVVESNCQQFVVDSHSYLCQLSDKLEVKSHSQEQLKDARHELTELVSLLALIVGKGKMYCTSQGVSSIMLGLQLIRYNRDVYRVSELISPLSATQRLLRSILLHHQTSANHNLHVFSAVCTKLVDAVVSFADQNIVSDSKSTSAIVETETELLACCQELHKIFSTMADYPKIFSKVSSFLIADVVHSLRSITLLPNVKKALHLAVNGLFDVMDEHCEVMLKVNLSEASREIYKGMQGQYVKYHKYTGKV